MTAACLMSDTASLYWANALGIPLGIFAIFVGIALCMRIARKYPDGL